MTCCEWDLCRSLKTGENKRVKNRVNRAPNMSTQNTNSLLIWQIWTLNCLWYDVFTRKSFSSMHLLWTNRSQNSKAVSCFSLFLVPNFKDFYNLVITHHMLEDDSEDIYWTSVSTRKGWGGMTISTVPSNIWITLLMVYAKIPLVL